MNNHPNKKELIAYTAKSLNKKASDAVASHLSECEECSRTVGSLNAILKASDNSRLVPPPRVKNRVLGLLNETENRTMPLKNAVRLLLRPAVYASLVIIAAISVYIITAQRPTPLTRDAEFTLVRNSGYVELNSSVVLESTALTKTGVVKTNEYSSAILNLDPVLSIKLAENSKLNVLKLNKTTVNDIVEYDIDLSMENGTILASSDHNIKKKFIISTKHAVFEALGTSFIVSANNSASTLSVLDGTVRATSKNGAAMLFNKSEGSVISASSMQKTIINTENENRIFLDLFNKQKQDNIAEGKDAGQDKDNFSSDNNESAENNKSNTGEIKKNKEEMLKENRQIQKEMRNNMKSGKRSQR